MSKKDITKAKSAGWTLVVGAWFSALEAVFFATDGTAWAVAVGVALGAVITVAVGLEVCPDLIVIVSMGIGIGVAGALGWAGFSGLMVFSALASAVALVAGAGASTSKDRTENRATMFVLPILTTAVAVASAGAAAAFCVLFGWTAPLSWATTLGCAAAFVLLAASSMLVSSLNSGAPSTALPQTASVTEPGMRPFPTARG